MKILSSLLNGGGGGGNVAGFSNIGSDIILFIYIFIYLCMFTISQFIEVNIT